MRRARGPAGRRFDSIVAAGPTARCRTPSPATSSRSRGELVVIDWGAEVDGYCSDCTRTVATGEPDEEAREVYELVLEAQLAGLEAVRAGVGGRDVDAAAREVIEAAGHGEHFGHGLGHGVGLEIHEAPRPVAALARTCWQPATSSRSSPASTCPGGSGCGSRTWWWSGDDGCEILTCWAKSCGSCLRRYWVNSAGSGLTQPLLHWPPR